MFITKKFCCSVCVSIYLTLPAPYISESCLKTKINLNFHFYASSLSCLKRFYEGLEKPSERPQRSVKVKILS